MKLFIDEVMILFPYDYIYPEQLEYMTEMKRGLDSGGHILLEMPSGTGKTISLLSLLVAYINHHGDIQRKVVYCTRTVVEMTKTVEELRRLVKYWEKQGEQLKPFVGVCLSARKNLCVNERVSQFTYPSEVDAACRGITASWVESKCELYEPAVSEEVTLDPGIYSLDDLKEVGRAKGACPYFMVRQALGYATFVVQSYLYLVDPRVSSLVMQHLNKNSIVVMDEGHNVDDVCIEAMSMVVTKKNANKARDQCLKDLSKAVEKTKTTNRQRLQDEYNKLLDGMALSTMARNAAGTNATQAELPADVAAAAIPGTLRQADHFIVFLTRLVDFVVKIISRMTRTQTADPLTFLTKVKEDCAVDLKHLRFTSERLRVLLDTVQESDEFKFRHLSMIAELFTTLATHYSDDRYEKPGFVVICEPFDPSDPSTPDPVLRLTCVDASLAVREVFGKFKSVVLTSGTLSPLDIYPKILGFTATVSKSFSMTMSRRCICPVIVTRTAEQQSIVSGANEGLSSSYTVRMDEHAHEAVVKAYGALLLDLAANVPDGIVCFFTGYRYMSEVMLAWHKTGFLQKLSEHKLIFVETQGVAETSEALANYRRACDIGRGAIFMSIARGKIAEGIDFDRHYGRAVVMFGVPFLPPTDESLSERLKWMETCLQVPPAEFRTFDAMRQASQCIGRVLRNKTDFGMMVLVDKRFSMSDKKRKFPQWVQECFKENVNLSIEAATTVAQSFFKSMAQPWDRDRDLGTTLLGEDTIQARGLHVPTLPAVPVNSNDEGATETSLQLKAQEEPLVAEPESGAGDLPRKRKRK